MNLRDLSNKELIAEQARLEKIEEDTRVALKAISEEIEARDQGVRVGEQFEFEGVTYKITSLSWSWPQAVWKTKKGTWSNSSKHCYGWKDWKAGRSTSPFKSAPFRL